MTNEEAIEAIKMAVSQVEWEYPLEYAAAFDMAIEALKKQSKWVPVSERLPDKSMKYVIFTLYTPAWHDVTDELPEEERDFPEETKVVCGQVVVYSNRNRYWCWEDEYGEVAIKNEHIKEYTGKEAFITAWMPLPEPYETGGKK